MNKDDDMDLGRLLQTALFEKSLSMRKLSALSGICTATISRIAAHKQPAGIRHLQAFSKHLDIPMDKLLLASGALSREDLRDEQSFSLDAIREILADFDIDLCGVTAEVRKELYKYQQYAGTEEGRRIIRESFPPKIKAMSGAGIVVDRLNQFYERFCGGSADMAEQAVIGGGLLYFVLTADAIPDYMFPVGYLDDAIAVNMVVRQLAQMPSSDA